MITNNRSGGILIMMVVLIMMVTVMFVSIGGVTNLQYHEGALAAQDETAFQVAEAGLNYARWRLAHEPDNFDPVVQEIYDPLEGALGTYTLTFTAPTPGTLTATINSVGHTANSPTREVTLEARYGRPSITKYSILLNDDYRFDAIEALEGQIHSNGGIRMKSYTDSLMTSAKATYTCKPKHGCAPPAIHPGIWDDGEDKDLWEFPVPVVDYGALTTDLLDMKEAAVSAGTYYDVSGAFGYHIVFHADNTYSLYQVTAKTPPIETYFSETGYKMMSHDIASETFLSANAVPSNGILFFEDTVWVNGDIRDRVSIASGDFSEPYTQPDIIINGSITYGGVRDGTRLFGAIAQGSVLIPYYGAPNNLVLDGAFIAQNGRFGRGHYRCTMPACDSSYRLRNSITQYGMMGSNLSFGTAWMNGIGVIISGYQTSLTSYDPNMLYGPPPFFPTPGEYQFLSWVQVE